MNSLTLRLQILKTSDLYPIFKEQIASFTASVEAKSAKFSGCIFVIRLSLDIFRSLIAKNHYKL